ncbi:MAG: S9 family peptidase [Aureisphaera sp.]
MLRYLLILCLLLFISHNSFSQEESLPAEQLQTKEIEKPEEEGLLKEVPVEVLFRKSHQHSFSISPNGKYFAEVVENNADSHIFNAESFLYIVDIDKYELIHKIPLDMFGLDALYWLTDNRILYESKGAIKAIDIDGNNPMEIVGRRDFKKRYNWWNQYKNIRYNSLISLLPSKEHQILVETHDHNLYAAIREVNIFTGEQYVLMHPEKYKVNKWITDIEGEPRLAMKFEEKGFTYYKFDEDEKRLTPFYVNIDGRKQSLTIDASSYLGQNITLEGFSLEKDIIFLTSNITTDKRKLISYDIEKEEVVDVLVEDVNCDVLDLHGEGLGVVFDYYERKLAGIKYSGLTPQYKWFSDRFAGFYNDLSAGQPQFFNEIIDSDSNSDRLLVYQWSDDAVGNIGVYFTKEKSYKVMFHFNEELNKYELSKSKNIVISAQDNYKLSGYLNFPVDYDESNPPPLVVIPHGGPWARDYWGVEEFSQFFATRGYLVLRINFRGSTGFGKAHALAGINNIDEVMISDIADATKSIIEQYNIDKNQVSIFGHSYGGYAVYMGLMKYPQLFNSGVAVSAPTDIKEWMKTIKKEGFHYAYEFWNTALGSEKKKYLEKISPYYSSEKIRKPVLIFHGKFDETISVEQAKKMAEKMKKEQKDVKIEILNSEGHSIEDSNVLGYVLKQSDAFFQKHRATSQ